MYSLTHPELDFIYIRFEKYNPASIVRFAPISQLNCQYLTINLYHARISNQVHIVVRSRSGSTEMTFTGSLDPSPASTTLSLISAAVKSFVPSSCAWVGDLLLLLRREIRNLQSMGSPARPSKRSTPRSDAGSQSGTPTDTESLRSQAG